jgi:hypothetical protein
MAHRSPHALTKIYYGLYAKLCQGSAQYYSIAKVSRGSHGATPCLIRLDDGGGSRWRRSRNDAAADPGDSGSDKSLAQMGQVAVEP